MARHRSIARALRRAGLLGSLALVPAAALGGGLKPITISRADDTITEIHARIAGDAIVWQRGLGAFSEIMRWNGGPSAENLSSNGVADENPETDGVHIVWQETNGAEHDIAVHDLLTHTTTLLTSPGDEITPLVSGIYLAWVEKVDADGEVFIDPGPPGLQITGNAFVESEFAVDGATLVWSEGDDLHLTADAADDEHEIALWNGDTQELFILNTPEDDIHPSVANGILVWQAGADGSGSIWMSDTEGVAEPLYAGTDERDPKTDGTRVVWEHWDGEDLDLYLVHLATPNVITSLTSDTGKDDVTPQIQGDDIVWVKKAKPGDSEIWVSWRGGAPTVLPWTHDNGRDDVEPRLDGDRFVYESCVNLGQPTELCDVVLVAPEPRATLLAAAALAVLAGLANRSARRATDPQRDAR